MMEMVDDEEKIKHLVGITNGGVTSKARNTQENVCCEIGSLYLI